ncbi:hypothetical protein I7X12_01235 [Halosimplex litoreum]|uniref:Uncharacterized protein n=1 Tax=Halosimplex litoreum TaxID=1198301 RepID=A0A7T3FZ29_9EURY|nr:hypothetical protein [Halosimplex litoreum]QPV63286.1 hypothetical protein I7X12_01235 [Halosimplex litoreum]
MRYKIVPPVRDRAFLADAQRAVPLVPGTVEDCCLRIVDETTAPSRDAAREYLTFLEALELVAETSRGFERRRVDAAEADLADAFERRVFGASELLDALREADSLTVEEAFDALREHVPRWERDRHTDWEAEWRERTERLLDWSVTLGLAVNDGDRYRPAERE